MRVHVSGAGQPPVRPRHKHGFPTSAMPDSSLGLLELGPEALFLVGALADFSYPSRIWEGSFASVLGSMAFAQPVGSWIAAVPVSFAILASRHKNFRAKYHNTLAHRLLRGRLALRYVRDT